VRDYDIGVVHGDSELWVVDFNFVCFVVVFGYG